MERYHATSVLSLTARHPARAGRAPGKGCNGERRLRFQEIYPSAAPLHFLSDLREDVDARGFL